MNMISALFISAAQNLHFLESVGRAGGGGSSSGGSGGSGGFEIVLGYLPMHFLGALFRKKIPVFIIANILGWVLAIIYAVFWFNVGFLGVIVGIASLVGMGAGLYNWFDKVSKLSGIAKKKQQQAVASDPEWDIEKLNNQVKNAFIKYQSDWSNNNSDSMAQYLTPSYLAHNKLMILALRQLGRRNVVNQPEIKSLDLVDVVDLADNSKDSFVMAVNAVAVDNLYQGGAENKLLFCDNKPFLEYWRFVRANDNQWLLDGISQSTEDPSMKNDVLANFAHSRNYCYSPDWGWLLLPSRGQLFSESKFGVSDINNHVIGVYNNTLIQIYNYLPNPTGSSASDNYLIAQVALPKSYGNIVVRKKQLISFMGLKNLTRIKMEWGEFNDRYEVWASDMERVTSFELLNPSFMVKLQELPFEVNIEVVDNIVYLYSAKIKASPENYDIMLTILYQAFKEMRM